jgi:hypothetical protein
MLMLCLITRFKIRNISGSLVITIKLKVKHKFHKATMLLLQILQTELPFGIVSNIHYYQL